MCVLVRMPQLAAGGGEAAIEAWLVREGDAITTGQTIVEIETDKAVVDYEAERAGAFAGALIAAGEAASVDPPIAVIASVGTVMNVALSADHRVLDGALAAERLAALVSHIESPLSILV